MSISNLAKVTVIVLPAILGSGFEASSLYGIRKASWRGVARKCPA
ncbi:MAG: hypothetical protein ACYDH4_09995 [Candidatus Cryosericum sp.]